LRALRLTPGKRSPDKQPTNGRLSRTLYGGNPALKLRAKRFMTAGEDSRELRRPRILGETLSVNTAGFQLIERNTDSSSTRLHSEVGKHVDFTYRGADR
jgi:hypothetical protein